MKAVLCALILILAMLISSQASAETKIANRLQDVLSTAGATEAIIVNVVFTDKGANELRKSSLLQNAVSPRALERRRNVLPSYRLVDETDLPVSEEYVETVASMVTEIRHRLKWFNSVTVAATPAQINELASLPFVSAIELVGRYRLKAEPNPSVFSSVQNEAHVSSAANLPYGNSFRQVDQIHVPPLHDRGNYAQGVIIGHFDNGVRLLEHEVFDSLKILGTRDFVDHKTSVKPNDPASNFGGHGVTTLSALAGYKPGTLIGPAFGATYILARTENDSSETPIEEDNWAAAIQWAESLGVQVTTTSLGYLDFDPPYVSWTWADMNGRTTLITRAAAMAVRKGVLVINSAGNNGLNTTHNTLNAPADADSVLSVGAVESNNARASFSSVGPTTSVPPRIKPDIMAPGTSIVAANSVDPHGYGLSGGTSLACPLAAGAAALLLKAHPEATPMQIIAALKTTASNAGSPNNLYGWGVINANAALYYLDRGGSMPVRAALTPNYPNPFSRATTITFDIPESGHVVLTIFDILGRKVKTVLDEAMEPPGLPVIWDGTNDRGMAVSSGVYICRLELTGASGQGSTETRKLLLLR